MSRYCGCKADRQRELEPQPDEVRKCSGGDQVDNCDYAAGDNEAKSVLRHFMTEYSWRSSVRRAVATRGPGNPGAARTMHCPTVMETTPRRAIVIYMMQV